MNLVFGSVFGFDYQNHIQTENRIKSSVWFGFGKFGSVISSIRLFLVRFDFGFRFIRIFRFFCSPLTMSMLPKVSIIKYIRNPVSHNTSEAQ
jgi:hypothetical protein